MSRFGSKKTIALLETYLNLSMCHYRIEGTDNPILLQIEDRIFTVFLKPICDVFYTNSNESTRVQLPKNPLFDNFKASKRPFLLIGFDVDNNVFSIWNPITTKERLNTKKNVSFYCRLNAQREANIQQQPIRCNLSNGEFVWIIPMTLLAEFLMYIEDFFTQITSEEYKISQNDFSIVTEHKRLFNTNIHDVLDENGKIIAIKNPAILKELKEAHSSGKPFATYDVLYKHYADKTYIMNLAEWAQLLNSINWNEEI